MRVLEQTSLVPVKKVKEDLNGWQESMKAEMEGLLAPLWRKSSQKTWHD